MVFLINYDNIEKLIQFTNNIRNKNYQYIKVNLKDDFMKKVGIKLYEVDDMIEIYVFIDTEMEIFKFPKKSLNNFLNLSIKRITTNKFPIPFNYENFNIILKRNENTGLSFILELERTNEQCYI